MKKKTAFCKGTLSTTEDGDFKFEADNPRVCKMLLKRTNPNLIDESIPKNLEITFQEKKEKDES